MSALLAFGLAVAPKQARGQTAPPANDAGAPAASAAAPAQGGSAPVVGPGGPSAPAPAAAEPAAPPPPPWAAPPFSGYGSDANAPPAAGYYDANALAPAEPQTHHPRAFALGLTVLKEHGFGAFARLRLDHVGLDVAGGFMPVIIMYQTTSGSTVDMDADMAPHGSASFLVFFSNDQKRFQNGLRLAGIYDGIMGWGGGLGWIGDLVWDRFDLGFGAGLQLYPNFNEKAAEHFGVPKSAFDNGSGVLTGALQIYLGINASWYLL